MEVRTGDRVALGRTLTKTGRDVLANDVATVKAIEPGADPTFTLRLDRTGKDVALRASDLAPPLRKDQDPAQRLPVMQHAYAQTIHKSQGRTADYTMVFGGAGLGADRAYVAMTRHRKDAVLFVDAGAIGERFSEDGRKADTEAVRKAFLQSARGSPDGVNAADFVRDRAAWLRTGNHRAVSDAPRLSRVGYAMDRAAKAVAAARRAVAERILEAQRGRETRHAAPRERSASRGMERGIER